jgi:DNA-binding winged helix-turn-helix (wHTH) protein
MSPTKREDTSKGTPAPQSLAVRFDSFELDEANASLRRDGKPIALAPTPFAVLCALVRQPGQLQTKQRLLDGIWGHQFVSDSVLKTVVSELRTLLGDNARKPRFIETVSRRGYRFLATTTPAGSPATQIVAAGDSSSIPASFIGRRDALAKLYAYWALARSGKRSLVWVVGEPGIGKTTLIEQFIASVSDAPCVRGQCVEQFGGGEPYLPVLEALGELCRRDTTAPQLLRAVAPTWLLQLPWLCAPEERDALRRELAGVGADRALREMGEFLDRYTEQRPLILVTEDLHWSDRATIQLIDYIARRRGNVHLMWISTFRLAEVVALDHPLNALRRELRLHRLCDEIVLDPFSGTEVAEYLRQRAPALELDETFVRALQERTDGLPLFVASVVSELATRAAQEAEAPAPAAQVARMAVPENLAAIIDRYIARLSDEQRVMLCTAAVCGVEFRVDTVAQAMGRDAAWVGQACDELRREGLWLAMARQGEYDAASEHAYSFRHAVFRQVLYDRTAAPRRAELHRNVGLALERERSAGLLVAAAELAAQFELGRDPLKAAQYFAEAAQAALRHFSPDQCMAHAEHGLALLDRVAQDGARTEAEFTLATLSGVAASHLLGFSSNEAKAALERAHAILAEVPLHRMRGLLLHSLGVTLLSRADYAEALAMAERSDALAAAHDDSVLRMAAYVVKGDVSMLHGKPGDSRAWFERGLRVIAELGGSAKTAFLADSEVTMLALLAVQLVHLGAIGAARVRMQEAQARADADSQPLARMIAIWFAAVCEQRLGDAQRVADLAEQMRALVDEFALAQGATASRWFLGWAKARLGEPREGYAMIREAYEENTRLGMLSGASETLGYAAEALLLDGDFDGARRELDEALQIAGKLGERIYLPQLLILEGRIARGRGDSAGANDAIRRAVDEARTQGAVWFELLALVELAEHGAATSNERRALAALAEQIPEADGATAFTGANSFPDQKSTA